MKELRKILGNVGLKFLECNKIYVEVFQEVCKTPEILWKKKKMDERKRHGDGDDDDHDHGNRVQF